MSLKISSFTTVLVQVSGDVFKFIEEYRGVSFMEAVQIIAERSVFNFAVENKMNYPNPKDNTRISSL